MKKKDVTDARLVEQKEQQSGAQFQATNVAPLLMTDVASRGPSLKDAGIRELAFQLYEQRGRRDGHDLEDWLEAEAIIRSLTKQVA